MRNKWITLLILALSLTILTGCWDSTDIENRDILTTVIVDYKDNNFCYITEIANITGQSSQSGEKGNKSSFSILDSKGKTLLEARNDYNRKTTKPLFLGAGRVLIFTDRMADIDIGEYINRARGQIDYRKSISLATTPNEPEDILNSVPENSSSVGFSIENILDALVKDGTSFKVNIGDALQVFSVKKAGLLVPAVELSDKKIAFSGYSVFKDQKKVGFIPAADRNGAVYLLNPNAVFYYNVTDQNIRYTIAVALKSKKITPKYENNHLKFLINMNFGATISFSDKTIKVDNTIIESITNQLNKRVKEDVEKAINTSQHQFKSDYLNFYKYFRIKYQSDFKKINWSDIYSNAQMNVVTNVNIAENDIPNKQ